MFSINNLVRPNIGDLVPYSSARDEFSGTATVFLDANENPYNTPLNRYPDPQQRSLKDKISEIKQVPPSQIFLGNGSDEAIDLLFRAFCEPGIDNVVAIDPSYGMYKVCAGINNVAYKNVLLNDDFSLNTPALIEKTDGNTKLIFLCSPNNPTGNCMETGKIEYLLKSFKGLVIVDEAYIDFAPACSTLTLMKQYPNLVILQTLSKAWGLAGIRLGMAFAHQEVIQVLNKIKYPYNINTLTIQKALEALHREAEQKNWVQTLLKQRMEVVEKLSSFSCVIKIYPTQANFVLVKVEGANKIYRYLVEENIIVRNRHAVALCNDCLRITIGTEEENKMLLHALHTYDKT